MTFRKKMFFISLFLVITAIIGGFFITGSPKNQRKFFYDSERCRIINELSGKISAFYNKNDSLPADLFELTSVNADLNNYKDPVNKNLPDYVPVSDREYKLCMTFYTSNLYKKNREHHTYYYSSIKHPAKYYCVEYKKDTDNNYFSIINN